VTAVRGAVTVEVNRTLWLLRQVARENGWSELEELEACTSYLGQDEDERPIWDHFLDQRATKLRSRRQVLLTKEDVRGGVVKWLPDFLRSCGADVETAVKRLRVGDLLLVDGVTIKRIS
jgi:hypothetical protein